MSLDQYKLRADRIGVHLAIFSEPFLSLLLSGKKTIESRFSINKLSPFQKVTKGDIVFAKKTGGEVCGFFLVGETKYFAQPTQKKLTELKQLYSDGICANEVSNFWIERRNARFISLLDVKYASYTPPIRIDKRDRTAWVVLKPAAQLL
jgi:hypothetical protein